jgi:hypothetical protein
MSYSVRPHSTLGTVMRMNVLFRASALHSRNSHADESASSLLLATQPRIFVRVQTYSFTRHPHSYLPELRQCASIRLQAGRLVPCCKSRITASALLSNVAVRVVRYH